MPETPRADPVEPVLPADAVVELPPSALVEALGGGRGLLDSALPASVFVVARLISGSLNTAIVVALLAGLVLVLVRRARGESLQQVGSGFFGLVIAVVFARATGSGEGFFLPGIFMTALIGVGFAASLVVRRPAVALALAAYDQKYEGWRDHPGLRRACTTATAVWAATFFVRAGVAAYVISRDGDHTGLVFLVVNVVKWSLIAVAALVTVVLVRRSGYAAHQSTLITD